jgi:hypothetical protein
MTETYRGGEPVSDSAQPVSAAAQTVKEQATQVVDEVRTQTKSVAHQVRDRVADEARTQNDRLASGLRVMASELQQMAAERSDSPARSVVERIAHAGEQAADYLSKHGPEGVLDEVQEFARRRPGAFLATALVSGFVVGRLGKAVISQTSPSSPQTRFADSDRYAPTEKLPMARPVSPTEPLYQSGRAQIPEVPL